MKHAQYTLITDDGKYGFRMENVDFEEKRDNIAAGLGETVVDSLYDLGKTKAEVRIEYPHKEGGVAVRGIELNYDEPRSKNVLDIGRRLTDATYLALEGAA